MKLTRFFTWLKLKREQKLEDIKLQAALRGVKLKDHQLGGSNKADFQGESVTQIAGMFGGKIAVQRVKVSAEELHRRRQMAEGKGET